MKLKRWLAAGSLVMAIILLGLGLAVFYFPHWLKHKIEKEISAKYQGVYTLKIRKLEASLFKNTLEIDSLSLKPNFSVWKKQNSINSTSAAGGLATLQIKKLRISELNYWGYLSGKPLSLDSVFVLAPQMQYTQLKKKTGKIQPLYKSLNGPLKDLQINFIRIEKGEIGYKNNFRNNFNTATLKGVDLEIKKIAVDSVSFFNQKRTFYAEEIAAEVGGTDIILPGEGHRLKMGLVKLGTKTGEIKMKAIKLIPLYNTHLASQKKKNTFWVALELPELLFRKVNFSVYSRFGKLEIDTLLANSPVVTAFKTDQNSGKNSEELKAIQIDPGQAKPLYKSLSGQLVKLRLKNLEFRDGSFTYKNNFQDEFNTLKLSGLNINVNDLVLDSASFFDPDRTFYAQNYTVTAANSDFLLSGGNYRLKSGPFSLDTHNQNIALKEIKLVPLYSPMELGRRKKRSTIWFSLNLTKADFKEVNFPAFSRSGAISIGSILFDKSKLKVFNDKKHFPVGGGDKIFPQDLMLAMKNNLYVGKTQVRNMHIWYGEFDEKASRPGYMVMKRFNCTVRNITNDKTRMSIRNPAVSYIHFDLKGQGNIKMVSRLNLLDPQCRQTIAGSFGKFDLQVFNSMMEASQSVHIKSGKIDRGKFEIQLTRNSASGRMLMLYKDFKIEIINADGQGQSMGNKITSFLANAFVVNSENPENGKPPREVAVNITRQKSQSFVSYWRDCLLTGIMTTVGLEKSK